jgi:hypothetical protein
MRARECEGKAFYQSAGCWLQRDGGQRAVEIRLEKSGHKKAGAVRVGAQPGKCQLIRRGKHHENAGKGMPAKEASWMLCSETERRVCCLNGLGSRRQIVAGDQIKS